MIAPTRSGDAAQRQCRHAACARDRLHPCQSRNRLPPALRERLRASAGTLFDIELGPTSCTLPTQETLDSLAAPVSVLVSADGLPSFAGIAGRLGQRLGVDGAITPGRHDAYHEYPFEFAAALRPFLRELSDVES